MEKMELVDIKGFENEYSISPDGNVFSKRRNKFLSFYITENGNYKYVHLYKNGKRREVSIHRLVTETFIPNPENKIMVNHIDGNTLNNCVKNLEWCTNRENQLHAIKIGLNKNIGENHKRARKVVQLDNYKIIKIWGCINDAERELKIHQSNIIKCCRGERKTTGGYQWKYLEEVE